MNRSDLKFKTDIYGITHSLQAVGMVACEKVHDAEQYELVKTALRELAVYAKARFDEKDAERKEAIAARAKENERAKEDAESAEATKDTEVE